MNSVEPIFSSGILAIRVEQARLLQSNAKRSAIIVAFIVLNTAALLVILGNRFETGIWVALALAMIVLTVLYARYAVPGPITQENVARYLRGHIALCACTGLVWSGFAIWVVDASSEIEVLVFTIVIVSITIGGLLPGSIYRPGYVALATAICPPFALSLLFSDQALAQYIGFGLMVYYSVSLFASVQNEVTIRDGITARLNTEAIAKIEEKNVEIERLMGMKSSFLSSLSHDFSQPLLAQRNFLTQLEETGLDARQKTLLGSLKATQSNQERLFQDLSDMNVEGRTFVAKPKTLDLQMVLASTVLEFEGVARSLDLLFDHKIDRLEVRTDPQLLSRMVRNLLSNAMKFTPAGGSIRIVSFENETSIGVQVSDTGVGIAHENLDRIFDAYVQFDTPNTTHIGHDQSRTSFGLGLSIVQKFAKLIDAEINISSEQGTGTQITILLPKTVGISETCRATTRSALLMFMTQNQSFALEPIIENLSMQGHRTLQARTANEAITLMEKIDDIPNLVITTETDRAKSKIFSDIALIREEVNENVSALVVTHLDLTPELNDYSAVHTIRPDDAMAIQDAVNKILIDCGHTQTNSRDQPQ